MKPDAVLSLVRAAATETAFATVGLTAYVVDAVRRPPSADELREGASKAVEDPVRTLVVTATALSGKGRQALGKARVSDGDGARDRAPEPVTQPAAAPARTPDVDAEPAPKPTPEPAPKPAPEPEPTPDAATTGAASGDDEVPLRHDLSALTVAELRQLAQDAEIPGRSNMKKKHLIEALEEYRSRT